MYKSSKFNVFEKTNSGDVLALNTLKMIPVKIPARLNTAVMDILEQDVVEIENKLTEELREVGLLVEESLDEIKLVEMKHNAVVYGTEILNVEILPTNDCNFNCSYCFEKNEKNYMNHETADSIISFFKREIPHCKKVRIDWFGGEPLLCKDVLLLIAKAVDEICRKNGVALFSTISTNGYLLDWEYFQKLIEVRVYEYQICIDGPLEFHNKTRPHKEKDDSYQKILSNLIAIKQNINSQAFSIGIRCNITPEVEPHLERHLEEMSKYFKNDSRFFIMFQGVRDWGGVKNVPQNIPTDESGLYKKWYARARELGLHCADRLVPVPFVGYCPAARKNGYVINYDGSLHKCSLSLWGKYRNVNNIGKILKNGKTSLDEGKISQWLVHLDAYEDKCLKCSMFPLCVGGFCFFQHHIKKIHKCDISYHTMVKEYLISANVYDQVYELKGAEDSDGIEKYC